MRYLTLLWTTALAIPLLAQAPTDDAPERRLLRAELLEISAGDLETATTIYRELASDEEAPASIRARALLYIGRTQRKLGELRAAEDTLREVLRLYPDDAAVARQAKSFLAELRSGKTTNVKFDWLAEMEAAPEIQARVFDLAMGLANEQWNPDDYGQLVALGRLAVPVVDKLAESTRQTDHRQRLTLVLLRSGRFDRLPWLLNGHIEETLHAGALDTFLLELSRSSPDERSRMVEALDRLPAAEPAYCAAALRLAAGDVSRLDAMLRDLEQARRTLHRNVVGFMLLHAKADPEVAATIAARILDADLDIDFRRTYYDLLKSDDSPQLGGKHLAALLRDVPHARAQHYVSHINDLEAYRDIAATELSGPVKKEIRTHFRGRYRGRFDESEAGWERVLRAVDGIFILQHLAETRDSAIDEFVDFLRNRRNEHPGYWSYNRPREDTSIPSRRARQRGGDDNRRTQTWKPSPRYADAMASLLDVEDPVALAVALEALSLEPVSSDADDDTRFDPIVRLYREAPDPHVREFAFYSLLRRYARAPELRRRVAAALLETTSREATPLPSGHYLESPLHDVPLGYARDRHRTERSRRHVGTERVQVTTVVAGLVPTWPFNRDQLAPEAATLLAELWALAETEADARLLRVLTTSRSSRHSSSASAPWRTPPSSTASPSITRCRGTARSRISTSARPSTCPGDRSSSGVSRPTPASRRRSASTPCSPTWRTLRRGSTCQCCSPDPTRSSRLSSTEIGSRNFLHRSPKRNEPRSSNPCWKAPWSAS
jgi:tetratricopeptide (TPR) repeat protein